MNNILLLRIFCPSLSLLCVPLPCRAVLENHHAALAFKLTLQHKKTNIFKNLDRYIYMYTDACAYMLMLKSMHIWLRMSPVQHLPNTYIWRYKQELIFVSFVWPYVFTFSTFQFMVVGWLCACEHTLIHWWRQPAVGCWKVWITVSVFWIAQRIDQYSPHVCVAAPMHTRECTYVLVMFSSENEIVDSLRFAFKVLGSIHN